MRSPTPIPRVLRHAACALLALLPAHGCQSKISRSLPRGHALTFLGGVAGVLDDDALGVVAGAQYRFRRRPLRFRSLAIQFRPLVGVMGYEGGGSYVYAGIGPELDLTRRLRVSNSLSLGAYNSGEIDLGGTLQFRTAFGISYALSDELRIGLVGDHLSHAGFGDDLNPGTESVLLSLGFGF